MRFANLWALALAVVLVPASGGRAGAVGGPAPGSLSAQTLQLPAGPGSVRGLAASPELDAFSGQVRYAIPIELPKAARGFAPSLALTYAGELGNGPLGIGWTLGLPEVRRSLRRGVPSYTDDDELELAGIGAGGRLVRDPRQPGLHWVEGRGTSLRVLRTGNRFEVTGPDGTRFVLGATNEGRLGLDKTQTWLVQGMIDLAGQEATFSYRRERGQLYLASVAWGPRTDGAPAFRAELVYESRPDAVPS